MASGRVAKLSVVAALVPGACNGGQSSTVTDTAQSSSATGDATTGEPTTGDVGGTTGGMTTNTTTGDATSSVWTTGTTGTTDTTGSPLPPPPDALWARSIGGGGDDYGQRIEILPDGSIRFHVDGSGFSIMDQAFSYPAVVEYDVDGNFVRTFTDFKFGTWTSAQDGGLFASVRPNDDPSITRYDPEGNPLWTVSLGNVGGNAGVAEFGRLSGGEVVAGVNFSGSIAGAMGAHMSAGSNDAFLGRFGGDGSLVWSKSFGGTGSDGVRHVVIDGMDRVVALGFFVDAIALDGTPLMATGDGAFLSVFTADGKLVWAKTLDRLANEIAVDPGGRILVLLTDLGPDTVALFNADGSSAPLSLAGLTWGQSIAFDSAARIYFTGQTLGPPDLRVAYLRVFDPTGVLLDERYYPGTALVGIDVAPHPNGSIVFSGAFEQTADFGSEMLMSVGELDAFVSLLPGVP